jgi:hypothetical protein
VNFTTLSELPKGAPIMTGTFTIHHQPAVILFDSGATHSFISLKFGTKIGLDFHPTKGAYMIAKDRFTFVRSRRNGYPPRHGLDD